MTGGRRWPHRLRGGWWREPPPWAWLVIAVGVVSIAVMTPIAIGRGRLSSAEADRLNDQSAGTSTSAAAVPASPTATVSPTDVPATHLVVIGDSDTVGFGDAGTGDDGWPALLERRLPGVDVETLAAPGAGYATPDPGTGQTFEDLSAAAPVEDAALIIVFGSRNDGSGIADKVGDAASAVFADIRERAPGAKLMVIGPPWPSETVPAGVRNNRDVISAAAEAAEA